MILLTRPLPEFFQGSESAAGNARKMACWRTFPSSGEQKIDERLSPSSAAPCLPTGSYSPPEASGSTITPSARNPVVADTQLFF